MRTLLRSLLIVLVAGWVYGPCLHGTWVWDDGLEVAQNAALREPGGWWRAWVHPEGMDYFPLKASVQWAEWQVWGSNPLGYHLVNLGLHVLSALLVWRLLAALEVGGAFLGGLLFAVHPVAVESVAWISELKNTLSLPPLLLASIAIVAFNRSGSRAVWLWALACFAAALACKTSVVMFPFAILLFVWWRRGRVSLRDLAKAAPFFAASLAMGAATVWFQSTRAIGLKGPHDPLAERACQAGFSLLAYLGQAVWPFDLAPIYPPAAGPLPGWLPWVALAALLGVLWWRREGFGRHALLGLGWFFLNLVPVLGLVPMAYSRISPRADHFAYVSLVGVVALAAAAFGAAQDWTERAWGKGGATRAAFALVAAALVALLARESHAYAGTFRDESSLWSEAVRRNPGSWLAYSNLGRVLLQEGRAELARTELLEAVRLRPDSAEALANLGNAQEQLGDTDKALETYRASVALDPSFAGAHFNFGLSLLKAGRASEASGQFRAALALEPGRAPARNGLGLSLAALGLPDQAEAEYRKAVSLDPDLKEARLNLGNALFRQGHLDEAVAQYRQALRIDPGYAGAHYNLGQALSRLGRESEAAAEFGAARHPPNR